VLFGYTPATRQHFDPEGEDLSMRTLALASVVGLLVLLFASPVSAFQCPKLVKQLQDATGQRFDATAADAKVAAVKAQALHSAGNHAESEKVAKEALAKLGIKS
jgi:ATP/maltotriose-dependent transcriptional regulator MalT